MTKNFGTCACGRFSSLNARGQCPDCVYKINHQGKSRQEIYFQKTALKPIKVIVNKTIKPRKKIARMSENAAEKIAKDEKTYEQVFLNNPNYCAECGKELPNVFRYEGKVVARFQYSHVMTKAAFPEFRHEYRNFNRLCFVHHQQWETGDRKSMKIYATNQITIQTLLDENNGAKSKRS